jgi:methylation protein EvaC
MPKCLVCEHEVTEFINFGRMPIANGFLLPAEYGKEYFFELRVGFCPRCSMVQLLEQPDREMMFHENYAYFSSISTRMAEHFKDFAGYVRGKCLGGKDPFVVELGSNDGIMLRNFAEAGIRHLGVEPSANVAEAARKRGVNTICEFFDEALAERVLRESGPADAILAANVMCHIPYLHSVAAGMAKLLAPKGVVMFEDPYLGDIVEKTAYDQIYDEHAFYFSVASVECLFNQHGLEVVDVLPQHTHGGSMRYVIARKGAYEISRAVADQKAKEDALGLKDLETFHGFRRNVEASRAALMRTLEELKAQGRRVVGYGATSKSTTVTMYCGITPEHVEFISDTTPTKQGKFSPGAHIPVKPYDEFKKAYPDVALLFAWNHGEEIMAKETAFRAAGGRWLVYVPKVEIL